MCCPMVMPNVSCVRLLKVEQENEALQRKLADLNADAADLMREVAALKQEMATLKAAYEVHVGSAVHVPVSSTTCAWGGTIAADGRYEIRCVGDAQGKTADDLEF